MLLSMWISQVSGESAETLSKLSDAITRILDKARRLSGSLRELLAFDRDVVGWIPLLVSDNLKLQIEIVFRCRHRAVHSLNL